MKLGCCCVCLKTGVSSHLGVQLRNAMDPLSLDGRCAPGMEPGVLHCCAMLSAALPSSCAPMQPLTSDAKDAALPCVTAHSALRAHDLRACLFAHLSLLHATPSAPTSCWLASMHVIATSWLQQCARYEMCALSLAALAFLLPFVSICGHERKNC